MNVVAWFAFGLALACAALWVALVVALLLVWGKARPFVQAYAPMLSAMMPAAAGTGDVGETAVSSPAATVRSDCHVIGCILQGGHNGWHVDEDGHEFAAEPA